MEINDFVHSIQGKPLNEANETIEKICGVADFFETEAYEITKTTAQESKVEYGDWQTNLDLAIRICNLLKNQGVKPDVVIEPTCGTGTFIIASMIVFGDSLSEIYGIEIYKPYINQLKHRILEYALKKTDTCKCRICLIHQNVFDFDFDNLHIDKNKNILILGNPPWVTNSKLCEINSNNLPQKSNFKKMKGLDAITGRANFDIAETITYRLLDKFHRQPSCLAFLMKNSVAKNIVSEQRYGRFCISDMAQYNIDSKKEFDVSVAASLFVAKLNGGQARLCTVLDLYGLSPLYSYGWVGDSFVSNVQNYLQCSEIDGKSQLTWWSGMKHDCSKVMELEKRDGRLYNKLGEEVAIEPDLIYPILKSSDIKGGHIDTSRKYVIVTQKKVSDDTAAIGHLYPLTYKYLNDHSKWFDARGSIIYRSRPKFCIFGIGSYSFQKYKIAIGGLNKNTSFSLVQPIGDKCVMLDDTCYFLGFDDYETAQCVLKILNSNVVQNFIQSLVFSDAKRSINKDLLMRIDLRKAATTLLKENYITDEEYETVENITSSLRHFNKSSELTLPLFDVSSL
ncbi:MAG: SAM-dependent methyltransferase [bacterium]|nr:SAM-dependent methyltransferase [Candidatus Minthenecus merdequi]